MLVSRCVMAFALYTVGLLVLTVGLVWSMRKSNFTRWYWFLWVPCLVALFVVVDTLCPH
jgi:ABC-type polysaccharide/polyol phosphate export permease